MMEASKYLSNAASGSLNEQRFIDINIDSEPDEPTNTKTSKLKTSSSAHLFNFNQPKQKPKKRDAPTFDTLLSNLNEINIYSDYDDDEEDDEDEEDEPGKRTDVYNLDVSYDLNRKIDPLFNSSTISAYQTSAPGSSHDLSLLNEAMCHDVAQVGSHSTPLTSSSINSIDIYAKTLVGSNEGPDSTRAKLTKSRDLFRLIIRK